MEGLEALMSGLGNSRLASLKPLGGEALANFRTSYQHIEGLEAGDKLRWKDGMADKKIPAKDEVCEVLRTFPALRKNPEGSNHDLDECDFSIAFVDADGDIAEHAFDSRRFERVAE